jgi:hypothetical protein
VNGNGQTYVIISRPTNYADADSIIVRNASVVVLGGTSGGPIDLADAPKVEVYQVQNTGSIIATRAQNVFIGFVTNAVGGSIQVSDVTATLNYVTNEGTVTVKGPGGNYAAYDIINKGKILIEAGQIDIRTVCPSNGTITVSEGVAGTIHYEEGCKGTITVPSTVILEASTKTARVMQGSFGMTVPDADAFVQDEAAKDAVAEGFAEAVQVQKAWVQLTATKATGGNIQSSATGKERLLAGTAVTIDYTLTIPDNESTAVANTAQGRLESISVAELSTSVAAKVQAVKGDSYSGVTITSKTTPAVGVATTTTPAPTSTSLVMTSTTSRPITSSGDVGGNRDGDGSSSTPAVRTNTTMELEETRTHNSYATSVRIHFACFAFIFMFLTKGLGSAYELSNAL